ncbi:MAG: toll/interleukin-1 receptor domain-containing protein [Luteolibacter sp.]
MNNSDKETTSDLAEASAANAFVVDSFSDLEWDNLVTFVQEGQVLPIVGKELSMVSDPETGREILFDSWLAKKLSEKLVTIPYEDGSPLNHVVCAALKAGNKLPGLVATIKRLISAHPFQVPEALKLLGEITDFRIFLTTAIDPLLGQAIGEIRGGKSPDIYTYGPKRFDDLPCDPESLPSPSVYHLFGRPDSPSGGAICEEDTVEWLTALQSPNHSPERLCSALENHHLLLIGLGFDGWLARFFMRAAKRQPLREDRDHQEYLADPAVLADGELVLFLRSMSRTTFLVEGDMSPLEFVRTLHKRWKDAVGETEVSGRSDNFPRGKMRPMRFLPPEVEMPEGAIFISYSRTDLEFAKRLKAACDERGIVTWFDMDRLEAGDSYGDKIRANIDRCRYVIPVISESALARDEAFFYMEWDWILNRKRKMAPGAIFALPIIIDSIRPEHPKIPEGFSNLDIPILQGGEIPEEFLNRLELLTGGMAYAKR